MTSTTSTITTVRASSFSAMRCAAVAPTFPAPTTVILFSIGVRSRVWVSVHSKKANQGGSRHQLSGTHGLDRILQPQRTLLYHGFHGLTAGYDNHKKLGGNGNDSVPLQLPFPQKA